MQRSDHRRRLLALAAAYLVGLQALLLPMAVAVGAVVDAPMCSSTASAGGAPTPANHNSGCACAAGCGMQCSATAFTAPAPVLIAVERILVGAERPLPALPPAIIFAVRHAHFARGPPEA